MTGELPAAALRSRGAGASLFRSNSSPLSAAVLKLQEDSDEPCSSPTLGVTCPQADRCACRASVPWEGVGTWAG